MLPVLERHALTDAVKQHCKDKHPRRNLRKIQSARWKAKDPVLMAWRKRANVKIIQTHQARRKDKCKGHAIIPLTVDWNEWPRRISPNRDALGRRRKPTAPRDGSFLTCTKCWRSGKMNGLVKVPCTGKPPDVFHVATRTWWMRLLESSKKNTDAIAKAWSTTVDAITAKCKRPATSQKN